jgi:hypothetical protein
VGVAACKGTGLHAPRASESRRTSRRIRAKIVFIRIFDSVLKITTDEHRSTRMLDKGEFKNAFYG